jgi:oligopeptide/dipeptide ABC transporter ATP-binding protein
MSLKVSSGNEQKSEPIMSISNLRVSFWAPSGFLGRKSSIIQAVDDVSFNVYPSETLSLVGESGSGKTTTARCIMRLTNRYSGSVVYDGVDIRTLKGKALLNYRRNVQVIYQDPYESLSPRENVFTAISTPLRLLTNQNDTSRLFHLVSDLLTEVGLDPEKVMNKLPHQLSGGERQRVNIARALAPKPKILVADEPITMLDASQKLKILSLLVQLKLKRNLTMLLITHDLASARIVSDRTAIMYLGRIVEIGPTEAILTRPHHPYTELILHSTPRLGRPLRLTDESLVTIEESQRVERGCIFRPRCNYATAICEQVDPKLEEKSKFQFAACHNSLNMQDSAQKQIYPKEQ